MLYHLQRVLHALRLVHLMFTVLVLLLGSTNAAGGSISSTHKNSSQQQTHLQQQKHLQQQQPQQQPQQQQPTPEIHQIIPQDSTRSHMRPHDQQEPMISLSHLPTITSSNSDTSNSEYMMKAVGVDEEISDPYQYLNDLKIEPRLTAGNGMAWNPYMTPNNHFSQMPTMLTSLPYNPYGPFGNTLPPLMTPRLLPFYGYPQPILIPLPMFFGPTDLLYPAYTGTGNENDESIPRTAGDQRAQSSHFDSTPMSALAGSNPRNSQIYFMRFSPMPYMFIPGLGFTPSQSPVPAIQPYTPLPALPAISPIWNIPLNFVANGKPTSIYQIGGTPNDIPDSMQFNNMNLFGIRPAAQLPSPFALAGVNRPAASNVANSYASHGPQASSNSLQQDSKMTLLKRPFFFNGRPDEIYTLPNNFNPLYSNSAYY
ncbi:PREDICTED: uncharacterized protein LOC108381661 [Rhagoletis zephyria]|uniref:uncharacterized protein LOC108381661 n=1 Tax=Rhagoletis zephyria TaxID=28612 RepID=UPI0008114A59|nr:PREDICTED: uncharacterized protein LOC108381661 [Rhagoletis zephyria]